MNIEQFRQRFLLQLPQAQPLGNESDRQAAVLLPVIAHPEPTLLLTLRSAHLRNHPGQVSFPGGKQDFSDSSLKETALRETQEELGLTQDKIEVIGQLPTVSSQTGFRVTPFVAILPAGLPLRIEAAEVAMVFEVPLLPLLESKHFSPLKVTRNGQSRHVWISNYPHQFIWGMTAGILRDLGKQLLDI